MNQEEEEENNKNVDSGYAKWEITNLAKKGELFWWGCKEVKLITLKFDY